MSSVFLQRGGLRRAAYDFAMTSSGSQPTVAKQVLGNELARLREVSQLTQAQAAKELGHSLSKQQKIEYGQVKMSKGDLALMLDLFSVHAAGERERLEELRVQGTRRGWWSKYGKIPQPFANYLGLETSASRMCAYESMIVQGLLQTEEYARANSRTSDGPIADAAVERHVQLKMERQKYAFNREFRVILDEAVLFRTMGSADVMSRQMEHLLKLMETQPNLTVQVLPFDTPGHPGTRGNFIVLDFPAGSRPPLVYVECQAGNLFLEDPDELHRCMVAWQNLTAIAASPDRSAEMIRAAATRYTEGRKE